MKTLLLVLNLLLASTSSLPIAGALLEAVEEPNNSIELIDRDIQNENQPISVEFELENIDDKGGISKQFIDHDNVTHTIEIETSTETNGTTSNIMSLQNKTYIIRHTKNLNYESSFKVDILSNKIQRAHSSNINLFLGTLVSSKLTRISSSQAQQVFKQKKLFVTTNNSITATVSSGKISIVVTP